MAVRTFPKGQKKQTCDWRQGVKQQSCYNWNLSSPRRSLKSPVRRKKQSFPQNKQLHLPGTSCSYPSLYQQTRAACLPSPITLMSFVAETLRLLFTASCHNRFPSPDYIVGAPLPSGPTTPPVEEYRRHIENVQEDPRLWRIWSEERGVYKRLDHPPKKQD